jgi:hypothetical protein
MRACLFLLLSLPVLAAERSFDFGLVPEGHLPPDFRSSVTGEGKPGRWEVLLDEVPPLLPPLSPQAPSNTKQPVLAQLAQDKTDEHFPLLIYEREEFRDFKLSTKFKTVRGDAEQMAGIVFRFQNESNYYVVRASSLGNTFRFYKVLDGQRGMMVGPEVPVKSGVWHELSIEAEGSHFTFKLDGEQRFPTVIDISFTRGKIGFWTKSDAVSYFRDVKITYQPLVPAAQAMMPHLAKRYPHLLGLKVYVPDKDTHGTRLVASLDPNELGQAGAKTEQAVIGTGETYYGKEKGMVSVIMPLRDRNGDTIAAVRVAMKSFAGQTEANAIIRASPIVKDIQANVHSPEDLAE